MADTAGSIKEALQALGDDRRGDAAEHLKDCLAGEGEASDALLYASLAIALQQLGEPHAALEAFDRAHYLQPGNPQVLYNYGLALETAGRSAEARRRYQAALKLEPNYERAQQRLTALAAGGGPPLAEPAPAGGRPAARAPESPAERPAPAAPAAPAVPAAPPPAPYYPEPPPAPHPEPSPTPYYPEPPEDAVPPPGQVPAVRPRPRRELPVPGSPFAAPPLRLSPEELIPVEAAPVPDYGAGYRLNLSELARSALEIWTRQPLLWLLLLAVPNGVAAVLSPALSTSPAALGWRQPLEWVLAQGLGMAATVYGMASAWSTERAFDPDRPLTPGGWLRGALFAVPYLLLTLGPVAAGLGMRTPLPLSLVLLAAPLLSAPFHALFAPALVAACAGGPGGLRAVGVALRAAGGRSWLHLGLLLTLGALAQLGLGMAIFWFVELLRGAGDVVAGVTQVAGLCVAQSVWAALLTVCGMDALKRPRYDAR